MALLRLLLLSALALHHVTCIQTEPPAVLDIVAEILASHDRYVHFQSNATNTTSSNITASAPSNSSGLEARQASTYWYESISHQGISAFGPSNFQVFRNVKSFGAAGDGITDDTAAINAAIASGGTCGQSCASTTTTPTIIYFPAGTYLISASLTPAYLTILLGNPNNRPTLLATSSFSGFGLIDGDKYYSPNLNWGATNVFWRQVRNFVLDLTSIPAGSSATGIHWPTAQATSLQNLEIRMSQASGTQHVGLFIEQGSGGFMTDLTFTGGLVGAKIGNQQFTMRNLVFSNCVTAISQLWSWGWVYQGLSINNCQLGLDISALTATGTLNVGSIVVLDSSISNTGVGILTAYSSSSQPPSAGSLILENIALSNVPVAVKYSGNGATLLAGGSTTIAGWGEGHKYTPSGPSTFQGSFTPNTRPSSLLSGSNYYTQSKPQYNNLPVSSFLSVRSAGASGNGVTDDTNALQNAINSATSAGQITFVDAGTYRVTKTITIPPGAKLVGEAYSVIMSSGSFFNDMNNPKPVVQVGTAGQTGQVEWSDMIVSTQGTQAGAILIEWNLATSGTPSGMWDVHTRIGGFSGSQLQAAQCQKNPGSSAVNTACIGAFMSMHVTASASGLYMENNWFWTADHDVDDSSNTQLDIYAGRGLYIESTAGTFWLVGTAAEHHTLYQYQLSNTQNIYMGFIQTETPYYQPNPSAPTPFTVNSKYNDPNFGSSCSGQSGNCAEAWGVRILNSKNVLIYGAGLYSFFNNYDQTCSNTAGPENCQDSILSLEGTISNVNIYGLSTVGTTNMVMQDGVALVKYSDNLDVYADTISLFEASTTGTSWTSLGCYTDSSSARTLTNYVTVPGGQVATTIEACQATCHALGYIFAGVEYGQECYCDNSLHNGGGPAPDGNAQCNMKCLGNSAETCGGPNRLDLYQAGSSAQSNWVPQGCYTDSVSARTLNNRITSIPAGSMSIETCTLACHNLGYTYAGVEYAQECYCDNTIHSPGGPAPDGNAQCNMACLGNPSETCGGSNRLDLYKYSGSVAITGWTLAGCYSDSASARTLSVRATTVPANSMSVEACQAACHTMGFALSGVEYAQECYCDNTIRNNAPAPDGSAQCNMKCLGSSLETCGGPNRIDVYFYTGWTLLGCFTDSINARALGQYVTVQGGQGSTTIEACQTACAGFGFAGVEYGQECYCDNSLHNGGPAPDGAAQCNVACAGNPSETCGGGNRLDLYSYSTSSRLSKRWNSIGCYTDSISSRALAHQQTLPGGQGTNTIEQCQDLCWEKGYAYSGVEYSVECYCGSSIDNGNGLAPNGNAGCNMACSGNQGEICGGSNRLSMYQYA